MKSGVRTDQAAAAAADGCAGRSAVVVFSGVCELPWLHLLKPGFRHCFIVVEGGAGDTGSWVSVNPLSQRTEVTVLARRIGAAWTAGSLAQWFRAQGLTAVACRTQGVPRKAAPWLPYTCVEEVKRVLGLQARRVFTPWRLYLHVNKYLKDEINP